MAARIKKPDFPTGLNDITAAVLAAYADKKRADPARTYLGASSWGEECSRKLAYRWHKTEPDEPPFSAELFAIFSMGHAGEPVVAEMIRAGGFELVTENQKTGKQFRFSQLDGKLAGNCDGIIVTGPEQDDKGFKFEYPLVWENKMLNDKSWKKTKQEGVRLSKPVYYSQMQTYMAYFDCPGGGLFTAMNRNTGELYIEHVPFDAETAQMDSDKAMRIVTSEDVEEFPRLSEDPDFFKCTYCEFRMRCHDISKPLLMQVGV